MYCGGDLVSQFVHYISLKMKKMYLLLFLVLFILFLYFVVGIPIFNLPVGKKYADYPYLYENVTVSPKYEIKKLKMDFYELDYIYVDSTKAISVVGTRAGDRMLTNWRIDKMGHVLDAIEGYNFVSPVGIFFKDDHYMDWPITGDKTQHPYQKIINYDDLSEKEFLNYIQQAELISFEERFSNSEDGEEWGWCYLKVDKNWLVIRSEQLKKDIEFHFDMDKNVSYYTWKEQLFPKSLIKRMFAHKLDGVWVEDGRDHGTTTFILKAFEKKAKSRKSFYDINNTSRSGWNGVGYFNWIYRADTFKFKSYVFDRSDLDCQISTFDAQKKTGFTFIYQYRFRKAKDPKELGLYLVVDQ